MIFIALGTNLPLANQKKGADLLKDALGVMAQRGLEIVKVSRFYKSEPVPISDQDWFVNAVAQVHTSLEPARVLEILHEIEIVFGRVRNLRNAARTLDLDLLVYHDRVRPETGPPPHVPHPRMHNRAFVLRPLAELAPNWCHPVTGASLSALISALPANQRLDPLAD